MAAVMSTRTTLKPAARSPRVKMMMATCRMRFRRFCTASSLALAEEATGESSESIRSGRSVDGSKSLTPKGYCQLLAAAQLGDAVLRPITLSKRCDPCNIRRWRKVTDSAAISSSVEGQTVPQAFLETVAAHGDLVALRAKNPDDSWTETTYNEFAQQVARVAGGLAAQGLGKGDRLMLMVRNMPEFHVLDTAALFVGATPVSIYNSSSPEQIEYLVNDAGATMAVVEDQGFYEAFSKVRTSMPNLQKVGLIRPGADGSDLGADFTYESLLASDPVDLAEAATIASPDDLATLIYTSGTTGPSKGVMIDHANVCWTVKCLADAFEMDSYAGKRIVSYLPMAHIAERMMSHYQTLFMGYEVTCCPDPTLFAAYAGEVHPNIMFGVPRVWEKIYSGIQAALSMDAEKEKAVTDGVAAAMPIQEKMTWGTATQEEIETYEFLDAVAFSTTVSYTHLTLPTIYSV